MPKRTDMSKAVILGAALLVASQTYGQQGQPNEYTVHRVCGKLYRHEKKKDGAVKESFEKIRKASVRLYRRDSATDCCAASDLVKETHTSRSGSFGFGVKDGTYWLVAGVSGTEFRMRIRQDKNRWRETLCSDNAFVIEDDGRFEFGGTATVE